MINFHLFCSFDDKCPFPFIIGAGGGAGMSPNKWGGSLGGGGAGAGGGMGGGKGIPLESTLGLFSSELSFLDSASNSRPKSVKSRSQILRGRSKLVTISSHLAWPSLQKNGKERGCVTDLFIKIP